MKERRAFSLAELVAAFAIITALTGCAALLYSVHSVTVEEGADELVAWILEKTVRAQLEESSFTIHVPNTPKKSGNAITLYWLSGRNKDKREIYRADGVVIYDISNVGANTQKTFSGEWQTLTPAATICVEPQLRVGKKLYVIISGAGMVRVSNTRGD